MRSRAILFGLIAVAAVIRWGGSDWHVQPTPSAKQIVRSDEFTFLKQLKTYPHDRHHYVKQTSQQARLLLIVAQQTGSWMGLSDEQLSADYFIYRVGRFSSLIAGLAATLVIFALAPQLGVTTSAARLLACGWVVFAPLLSVYGHLFLADIPNLLWIWLGFLLFTWQLKRPSTATLVLFSVCVGFAGATKFSFLYLLLPSLVILVCTPGLVATALILFFVTLGAFWLGNGFAYDAEQLLRFLSYARGRYSGGTDPAQNIPRQLVFLISACGIPAVLILCTGAAASLVRRCGRFRWARPLANIGAFRELMRRHPGFVIGLSLAPQFIIFARSGPGGMFARHVIPFVPGVLLASALAFQQLFKNRQPIIQRAAAFVLIGYQLLLCLDAERGFFHDPRQQAREWLQAHRDPSLPVIADEWAGAAVKGLPGTIDVKHLFSPPIPTTRRPHFLMVHQATYGRYLLSESCDDIYHCFGGLKTLQFYRKLIGDQRSQYRLAHTARTNYWMPEHRLSGILVGTQPYPLVGSVKIFRSPRQ